ncbi:MAG: hypothetical protein QM737_21800 [Ferruginibacter sp.]
MNNSIIFFLLIFFSLKCFSQNKPQADTSTVPKTTFRKEFNHADIVLARVTNEPEFPGGKTGWIDYLKKNIKLSVPLINKAVSGTYHVVIRYTVEREGTLRNIGAASNCGYGMEAEVIRCMKASPIWKPAQTANKEIVSFATKQLVIFKIKGDEVTIEIK